MEGDLVLELGILLILIVIARILFVMHKIATGHNKKADKIRTKPAKTLICIGSGGHTTEMLKLVEQLDFDKYTPRIYVLANSDTTSVHKIEELEKEKKAKKSDYFMETIPRSRIVQQSYFTAIFTTIYSTFRSIPIVCTTNPDLMLCNGPGTCIPLCVISFLLKTAFICDTRIVFIESYCRTQSFSLSGKILSYLADNILVQWPTLKRKLKRAEYVGQLM